jgi:hypothetical protein
MKNSTSNASKTLKALVAYPILTSKVNVKLIHVLSTLDNSQCPHD